MLAGSGLTRGIDQAHRFLEFAQIIHSRLLFASVTAPHGLHGREDSGDGEHLLHPIGSHGTGLVAGWWYLGGKANAI